MPTSPVNPTVRSRFSPIDDAFRRVTDQNDGTFIPQTFAGGDLEAYINNIKVANLEAITWSISVEIVGNYAMGQRDALSYTKGKRVIVGSLSMTQWDRHVLLEQVFALSEFARTGRGPTFQDLYAPGSPSAQILSGNDVPILGTAVTTGVRGSTTQTIPPGQDPTLQVITTSSTRGLSRTAYENQLKEQIYLTARSKAATRIVYPDQIPPFDLTLVGANPQGAMSFCTIFGIHITQETGGFSMNDVGNTVGMSWTALHVEPWRPVNDTRLNTNAFSFN